jgi:hypothetical protein
MHRMIWRTGALGIIFLGFSVHVALAQSAEDLAAAAQSAPGLPAFDKLLAKLPSVKTKDAAGIERQYYIIEGDIRASAQQVFNWASEKSRSNAGSGAANSELIVLEEGGNKVFWPPDRRTLTYSVDRSTFRSQDEYNEVVKNFAAAATEWEGKCTSCGLAFRRIETDAAAKPLFKVEFEPLASDFIAAAFFPNDPSDKRVVSVGPQYFTTSFNRVGVFRHEIGHILGYRHTHIIGVPGCEGEGGGWIPLTPDGGRDKDSVMHYFCGGGGTRELSISALDEQGHRSLYGP